MGMIRALVKDCIEGAIKRFTADGRTSETILNREYLQHYGFTSRPLEGAEMIVLNEGNHIVAIASDDRRYRLELEAGEVALYTDEGDHVHFKRDGEIRIVAGTRVVIETPALEIIGSDDGDAAISYRGNLSIEGNVTVTGSVTASGDVLDGGSNTNHHSHSQ